MPIDTDLLMTKVEEATALLVVVMRAQGAPVEVIERLRQDLDLRREELNSALAQNAAAAAAGDETLHESAKFLIANANNIKNPTLFGISFARIEEFGGNDLRNVLTTFKTSSAKGNNVFHRAAIGVAVSGYVECPLLSTGFYDFVVKLARPDADYKECLTSTAARPLGPLLPFLVDRLEGNCRRQPGASAAGYNVAILAMTITKPQHYAQCDDSKNVVRFLLPIWFVLTEHNNMFTLQQWESIFHHQYDAQTTASEDAIKKEATDFGLAGVATMRTLEYLHQREKFSTHPAMVTSGGFIRNWETPVPALPRHDACSSPGGSPWLATPAASQASSQARTPTPVARREGPPPMKQHRGEAPVSRERLREAVLQSGICRFCGHTGHKDVFAKGARPTECPRYETHPLYNPDSIFEYAYKVLTKQAEPSQKSRA
jgi:hypothetical protein